MIRRRDAILGVVVFGAFFFTALFLLAAFSAGMRGGNVRVSKRSIAVVEITGAIFNAKPTVDKLERYMKNDRIPVIVIRLNTPGGGIEPTQEIYSTILKARGKGKKVVASMGTVAASGGYYIAAACDTVMASPGTLTGSIGVIADFMEFSGLLKKIGVDVTVVKSGKFKDIGSFSRQMTDEEKGLISGVIMDSYDQFVEAVAKGRRMDEETVKKYADGRVFTGRQAKEIGFVDALGTYQDAIDMAGRMAGLGDNPPVVMDERDRIFEALSRNISHMLSIGAEWSLPSISYRMQ
jgi:protease IV